MDARTQIALANTSNAPRNEAGQETLRLITQRLERAGDAAALIWFDESGTRTLSFSALHARVQAFADHLLGQGIEKGTPLALIGANGADWAIAALGMLEAGCLVVPIDAEMDDEALQHTLNDAEPARVFADADQFDRLERFIASDTLIELSAIGHQERCQENRPRLDSSDQAVMFYTSGTTGPPKGVPLTHDNLRFEVQTLLDMDLMRAGERVLLPLPLHHVYPFVVGFLAPMLYGVGVILPKSVTGPDITEATRNGGAATIIGVPRLYEALVTGVKDRLNSGSLPRRMTGKTLLGLSRFFYEYFSMPVAKKLLQPLHDRVGPDLRLLASGGAPLDPELAQTLETLGWTVATGYGLTETAPMLTIVPPESRRFDTAGQPIPGVELRIAQMESGATGDIGEIQAKGPNVFNGYHGLAEETRKAFTDDGWYRTGDRGWMEADGHLHVLGRSATFVVTSSGQNISIENVEQAYERHWLIEEAGVFMRDNRLCAVIRPDPKALRETEGSAEQAVQKAMREIAERRPERERIARFALTAEPLERTRIGDLQRDKLVARYDTLKQGLEGGAEGPQPIEEMNRADQDLLADKTAHETWSLLSKRYPGLRLTPGSHMDVDLGVDSLEWAGLTLDLRDRVGVELDEESIGRIETVRDLLQEVRDRAETAASAADVDPADEPERFIATEQRKWLRPLNAVQRGFAWFLFALNRLVMKTVFRLEVQGQDNLKEDSQVVITPNHTSFLDPFAIAAALPYDVFKRSAFAASTAVAFANPFFRFIVRHGRTFPIEPGRAALSNLAMTYALVDEGLSLVWFPEGFRSPDGELQSVKPGIGAVLEKRASPVVPTIIAGAHEAMPVGRRFPRPRRISVHFGEAISSAKLAEKGEGERTKERIASGLGSAMAALKSKVSS